MNLSGVQDIQFEIEEGNIYIQQVGIRSKARKCNE